MFLSLTSFLSCIVPENIHYKSFVFSNHLKNSAVKETVQYRVESDWSGGAFLIVAGAINGNISVNGLDINSTQADKKIMEAIQDSGANFLIEENKISFYSSADINLKAFEFDATDCPDLFPPLAALAAYCKGVTTIKGVKRLTHKESNRSLTIQQELGKMGILIDLNNDVMQIHGGNGLNGANTYSNHDHRIAMMCAIAALKAEGETMIEQAEAVDKSYPAFWEDLKTLQAAVSYQSIEIPL